MTTAAAPDGYRIDYSDGWPGLGAPWRQTYDCAEVYTDDDGSGWPSEDAALPGVRVTTTGWLHGREAGSDVHR